MYDGYLNFGGNEIGNNARSMGYARTADCPMAWFKGDVCEGIFDALAETDLYDYANITKAPWYDSANADVSSRFFGVFIVDVEGVENSTRQVSLFEGINDGGVLGPTRKAAKSVRVKAVLIAEGEDALGYGMAWLSAVLDPGACGQHGSGCGTSDLAFFAACPPSRSEVTNPVVQWGASVTNLATNPSFEAATATTVEVRRNHVTNPRLDNSIAGWAYGAPAVLSAQAGGGKVAFTDLRTYTAAAYNSPAAVATVGESWYAAMDVTVPVGQPATTVALSVRPYAGSSALVGTISPNTLIQPGETKRLVTPVVVNPATTDGIRLWLNVPVATTVAGQYVTITNAILEKSLANTGPYFDGATLPAGDFTHAWTGTVDASPSVEYGLVAPTTAPFVAAVVQSSEWAASGTKSIRIIPNAYTSNNSRAVIFPTMAVVAGDIYTIKAKTRLAAPLTGSLWTNALKLSIYWLPIATISYSPDAMPNAAGTYEFTWTVTVPAGATSMDVRMNNGAPQGGGDVWVDDLLVVKGVYTGPFFDGSTPDTGDPTIVGRAVHGYAWTGTEDASTSTSTPGTVVAVEDPVAWQEDVDGLVRYLHDVGAVSGPLVTEEMQSGPFYGFGVEFTFTAEKPWVYKVTKPIALPPSLPVVVQDIPFNLARYPSAELPGPTLVIATNFSTNPSVETDATGWTTAGDGAVILNATLAGGRTTELAAQGVASYRSVFTASGASAVGGYFQITHTVPLPHPAVAGEAYSVSIWTSRSTQAGAPVYAEHGASVLWRDAGGTTLRQDSLGVAPAGGGALSAKSLIPPVGATQALVRAHQYLTSWNAGTIVRLYADAVTVSVP